jgi:integrase
MPFRTKKTRIYQYDIIVKGRRFRGSCGTADYEEAKAVEAEIRANAQSEAARGDSYTLSEALGTYYRDKATGTPSEATTRSQAKAILKHLDGRTRLHNLTNADIMKYVAKDRATCSNATVNRRLQMLGRALRHMEAIYEAKVADLNLRQAETKEPRERVRELSMDEQERLFTHLPIEYHPFVSFALMTGARIATISGLQWSDVDMANREIRFRLKGDHLMLFPINGELAALLSALPQSNVMRFRSYVFNRVDQQTLERVPIHPNGGVFGTAWRKALSNAEIHDFRFHDLRHTFATRMLRQTQNLKLVSQLLGHKDIATTSRYAHVLVDDMRAALDGFSVTGSGPKLKQNKV